MPQYAILIYSPGEGDDRLGPEEAAAEMPKWIEYTQALIDDGVYVAGEALHGVEAATSLRERDGEMQITDGPFAETKEILGGFYIVDVPDLDTALKYGGRIPSVGRGTVEVRPVMVFDNMPSSESTERATA